MDKGQDPETQQLALREYAARRGFGLVGEYVDYASGTQEDRPQYQALLNAVRKRQVDAVLVWRYDRFARSTQALVNAVKEFHRLRVDFISYQENIDTTIPQGELVFTVMASLAQFESTLIGERVKAGMMRAKAQGKRISRLPIAEEVQARIAALYAQGGIHSSDQQAAGNWLRDRMELRAAEEAGMKLTGGLPPISVHLLPGVRGGLYGSQNQAYRDCHPGP